MNKKMNIIGLYMAGCRIVFLKHYNCIAYYSSIYFLSEAVTTTFSSSSSLATHTKIRGKKAVIKNTRRIKYKFT